MEQEIIYSSEYLLISKRSDGYYIESFKPGMSIDQFNKIISEHNEIKIISFVAIKNAVLRAPTPPEKFGIIKDRVLVEVTADESKAYVTLFVSESEFNENNKSNLLREIKKALSDKGVIYGIKDELILANLCNNRQILVAEGLPPISGADAVVRMYEVKEARPEIREDGKADYYELNLINKVDAGDWLGERIDPTQGIPGKSVRGKTIEPALGKNVPLLYDKSSVREVYDNGVTTLLASRGGAVTYKGDTVGVSNHLEISDGIGVRTGNIDFDGYLTVKGSIEDNYSVEALDDIEILGDYGIGSVKEIVSRKGSIYIKGGIAGKSKAIIKSKCDIYTKFVSDATIICEGRVHVGFYCLNSNIRAKEVILDSAKGQIIGGRIEAEIKVVSSIIGSPGEKKTYVNIKGLNRTLYKERLEAVLKEVEILKIELNKAKNELSHYQEKGSRLSHDQWKDYEIANALYGELRDRLKEGEKEKASIASYLRTHGDGEVNILKKAYPGTILELRHNIVEINHPIMKTIYYLQGTEVHSI